MRTIVLVSFVALTSGCAATAEPEAPEQLSGLALSPSSVRLFWADKSEDETVFLVERAPQGASFAWVATLGANVTTYDDRALAPDTVYRYRVFAHNAAGDSLPSAEIVVSTLAVPPPWTPIGVTASTMSPYAIELSWTDMSQDEWGFIIERETMGGGVTEVIASVPPGVTTYRDDGLPPSTSYAYRVRSANLAGMSPWSNTAYARTMSLPMVPMPPVALSALAVTPTMIRLSWTDGSTSETKFEVERRDYPAGAFFAILPAPANATSYEDWGVEPGRQYWYRIRARNDLGASAYTPVVSAKTVSLPGLPLAPRDLSANAISPTSVELKWTDASDNESGFVILRAGGASSTYVKVFVTPAGATGWTDTGLAPATVHRYLVQAVNEIGTSAFTLVAVVATPMED